MRRMAIQTVLSLSISTIAAADVVRHDSFPEIYWGRWMSAADEKVDRSVIVLSAKSYVSGNVSCRVDWVAQTASARGSVYSAHLRCADRAGKAGQRASVNLIIRPNNVDRIEVGSEYANLRPYRRCSATCPVTWDGDPSEVMRVDELRTDGAEPK